MLRICKVYALFQMCIEVFVLRSILRRVCGWWKSSGVCSLRMVISFLTGNLRFLSVLGFVEVIDKIYFKDCDM